MDDVQTRRLNDGRAFDVRKVHYPAEVLAGAMEEAGLTGVRVETTDRFFVLGSARRP